jgi:glycosyltransferase involved in cell wall biosynthesis
VVNALRFVAVTPAIVRLARRRGILHIQGNYFVPLYAGLVVLARLRHVPVVYTPHNLFDRSGPRLALFRGLMFRLSKAIILHVQAEVDRLPPAVSEKAVVIPVGTYRDLARTGGGVAQDAAKRTLGLGDRRVVGLLFGQLRPDKGIVDLLAAAELVPELAVVIAGQEAGGLATATEALAAPALKDRLVVRQGYLSISEAATIFAAADVAVHPYPYASQSAAALLAYAFDTPIVVYPVGGLPDLVEVGQTGWITKRPDVHSLVETLREVTALGAVECKRRGLAGGRLADERYSWKAIGMRTSEVYRQIAST